MRRLLFPVGVASLGNVGTYGPGRRVTRGGSVLSPQSSSAFPAQVWVPRSSAECVGTAAVGSTMASMPAMAAAASSRGV